MKNPSNKFIIGNVVERKKKEEENRVGDQKFLLEQYTKKIDERKRFNNRATSVNPACKVITKQEA